MMNKQHIRVKIKEWLKRQITEEFDSLPLMSEKTCSMIEVAYIFSHLHLEFGADLEKLLQMLDEQCVLDDVLSHIEYITERVL
jgi:hypothetical protein